VGAWPITAERFAAYLGKASKEAKLVTSHVDADADVDAAVAALGACGLLRRETPLATVPAAELRPKLKATLAMWRRQIGYHKLFEGLVQGRVRVEVLQGLFIETYHVVRLAAQHIATAVAAAEDPRLRAMLSAYLADELGHEGMLLETCVNLGCRRGDVVAAHPTVGTLSLINMLCDLGRRDTLAYVAGTTLFEALPEDEREGEESVAELVRHYGVPAAAFGPALRHLQMDARAGHASLLDHALDGAADLPAERVHGIVNMLHDLKHAYDLHHDQILHYYGDISNYIPRPKVDYFSL
jgi:pyrroloquinoline quinone (PQQ) biosynthesis protein C